MSALTVLFYFGLGMFVPFVLLLGLSFLDKSPNAVFVAWRRTSLRRVGVALLMLTIPVLLELFRDFLPAGSIFSDYLLPSVDVLASVFLLWSVFLFLRQGGYSVLPFTFIVLSALLILLCLVFIMRVDVFLMLVGLWLFVLLLIFADRAIRHRALSMSDNSDGVHFHVAGLSFLFLLNFIVNPLFLYVCVSVRAINFFSAFFLLAWMSMGLVVLRATLSTLAGNNTEPESPMLMDDAVVSIEETLTDNAVFRTADDCFSIVQQKAMKAQLEKMMRKGKLYRSADLVVGDLVNHFDTNATYFYYFMRDVMHSSFFDYVNTFRVNEAKERLLKGEAVDSIVNAVGYNSASAFRRAFKRNTGMTPTEWKHQNENH
ncbi:MAG: AraC family transcriptional regulator [Bacteroidales bacterium]|nr:AraC family transcriptional regulator [Bacteroidales bacterium]